MPLAFLSVFAPLREPPFQATAASRKAAKPAKEGSFLFPKKKVVVAFLCVFAPLRELPFHAVPERKSS